MSLSSAARLRDTVRRMIRQEIETLRPRPRYATVVSYNRVARTCVVNFPEAPSTNITIKMGSVQPSSAGQVVRIEGTTRDRYITDVMGQAYVDDGNVDIGDTAWHNIGAAGEPAFESGWRNHGGGWVPCRFRKDANGFVHVEGMANNNGGTATTQTAFTLPVGYRPSHSIRTAGQHSSGSSKIADVRANGAIFLDAHNTGSWIGFSIVFLAEQ